VKSPSYLLLGFSLLNIEVAIQKKKIICAKRNYVKRKVITLLQINLSKYLLSHTM
jgi:hypothetical protein